MVLDNSEGTPLCPHSPKEYAHPHLPATSPPIVCLSSWPLLRAVHFLAQLAPACQAMEDCMFAVTGCNIEQVQVGKMGAC